MSKIFRGEANIEFIGRMGIFGLLSGIAVTVSIAAIIIFGLNFGIDFAGGYEIHVKFEKPVTDSQIKQIVKPLVGDARVQRFGEEADNEYLILVREHGTVGDEEKVKLLADYVLLAGDREKLTLWSIAESGESLKIGFDHPVTEDQVRDVLDRHQLSIKSIKRGERSDQPVYEVALLSLADQIDTALHEGLSIADSVDIKQRVEFVGPQVGAQLRNQGIMSVLAALFFILLYIGIRFDLFFAPGAVIALVHDVAITIGVFAIFQIEFNLPIIAATLAIIGYSLNDTIVVYDRVRENVVRLRGRDLRGMVNTSLNQTLSRTILTSLTTLMVVGALLVFGGATIRGFSIALFIGVVVGTYSSVAIATPAYVLLRERYGKGGGGKSDAVAAA